MRLFFSRPHLKWHRKYGFDRCCICAQKHYGKKRLLHELREI